MTGDQHATTLPAIATSALGLAPAQPGWVHLVGAGPGDPGLLTLRGAALLASADLVAYDRLADSRLLDLLPPRAEAIRVGKTPRARSEPNEGGMPEQRGQARPDATRHRLPDERRQARTWTQDDITALVVRAAAEGKAVVRLKGGDPFVFGRGGEEALACRAAGIPFEVVSGVSSAIAGPAAAGIPVTHRGLATGVAFVTGHEDPDKPSTQVDWEALARFHGTLVFLMGVRNAHRIQERLRAHGRPVDTPVAVVQWATTPRERSIRTTLGDLASDLAASGIGAPATIVVGDVVSVGALLAPAATTTRDLAHASREPSARRAPDLRPPPSLPPTDSTTHEVFA